MKGPPPAKTKILTVLLLAGTFPALVSFGAHWVFGDERILAEPLHDLLELTGSCIALIVAMLLLLRFQYQETPPHLLRVAAALIAMGISDGVHSLTPFGLAFSWTRHAATLLGGLMFAQVWVPLPGFVTRRKALFILLVALAVVAAAGGVWWGADRLPAPFLPAGYSFPVKATNTVGGIGFLAAALFFLRRYWRQPRAEEMVFASHTLVFGMAGVLFGYSHVWAADWWVWHGARLLAYLLVGATAYEIIVNLLQTLAQNAQRLEVCVRDRTAQFQAANLELEEEIKERKQAEVLLRKSEERQRILADTAAKLLASKAPQALIDEICRNVTARLECDVFFNYLLDPSMGKLRLNAFTGIPAQEANGLEWLELGQAVCGTVAQQAERIVAENIPNTPNPLTNLVRSFGIKAYACFPLLSKGTVLGTLSFGSRTRESFSEESLELIKSIADLVALAVERMQARAQLQANQERLKLAQVSSGAGWWDWDIRGEKIQWSEELFHLFGLDQQKDSASFDSWRKLLYPEDRPGAETRIQEAIRQGTPLDSEYRIKLPSGEIRWIKALGNTIYDDQKEPLRMLGICLDVTERKRAEIAQRESDERIQQALRVSHSFTFEWRQATDRVVRSDSCASILRLTGDEAIHDTSERFFQRVYPEDREKFLQTVKHLTPDSSSYLIEFRITRGDGSIAVLEETGQASFDSEGKLERIVGVATDITKRKRAEEEIRHLNETLEQRVRERTAELQASEENLRQTQQAVMQQERLRALGQMASGIAHDINNAISPVTLYTDWLLENDSTLSPDTREALETIQRAIGDVAATVGRMREFYRKRDSEQALEPICLNPLVQQVIDLTRARWSDMPQRRGIVIQMRTDLAAELPSVLGIESEIREALTNLVFNAVDAMPTGGTLTLRTRVVSLFGKGAPVRSVHLEVADTGTGMDEETRQHCLEPFFTTKGEHGTGLGLAMVYGVARRHRAEVEIETAMGKGTLVRLCFFPAAASSEVGPTKPSLADKGPGNLRILLVDDDPMILRSLQDALQRDGNVVVPALGGQAGIDTFRTAYGRGEHFNIVITDLGMPYVDGQQVALAIKAIDPAIPIILLTGWGQRAFNEDEVPPQVDGVLGKPPKLQEIREMLCRFCLPTPG